MERFWRILNMTIEFYKKSYLKWNVYYFSQMYQYVLNIDSRWCTEYPFPLAGPKYQDQHFAD